MIRNIFGLSTILKVKITFGNLFNYTTCKFILEIIGLIAVIPFVNFLTDYNSFQDSKFFFIEKFLILLTTMN